LVHAHRFFEVNDMNSVAMAENERGHLWIPEACLVTKVDASFQHFAHCYGHNISRVKVWNPLSHRVHLADSSLKTAPFSNEFAIYIKVCPDQL